MNQHRLAATLLVCVAVLVAACGSDSPITEQADQADSPADETSAPTTIAINQDSPIESLLGLPVFDDDAMNDWFRELDLERQQLTAKCMIAEGFEYSPEGNAQSPVVDVEFATNSREYAATYGFGIGLAFNAAEYDPDADYSTPNSTYVASLSEGETEAYYLALYGEPQDGELAEEEFDDGFGGPGGGCLGDAFREVFSIVGVMFELTPTLDGYYDKFQADSRIIELNGIWQRCMSEAGFTYDHPDEVAETFYPQLDRLISDDSIYESVDVPDDVPDQGDVFFGDTYSFHPKLTAEGQARLDDFISNEIATAVAHWDCREPLIEDELAVQREYEGQFVEEVRPLVQEQLGD